MGQRPVTVLRGLFSRANPLENPARPLTDSGLLDVLGGAPTAAGVNVTETSSLRITAVWRAVGLIAGTAGSLPLHAYRALSDDRRERYDGPWARVLDEPHPDMPPMEWWETFYLHQLLWGNGYAQKFRDGTGVIRHLEGIHPARVNPKRVPVSTQNPWGKAFEIATDDGGKRTLTPYEVFHVPALGYDGVRGLSPIAMARQALGLALAAEEFGARLYGSGSLLGGVLQTDKELTPDQAAAIKKRWQDKVAGLAKSHEIAVLDRGVTFTAVSIPPADAQFIENRHFSIAEVSRLYGVPPHMLGDVTKSTSWGSGIEQQTMGFVRFTLQPWLTRNEQRASRELLVPGDRRVYARYSLEGLLRGDTLARYRAHAIAIQHGIESPNEARRLEDRPPYEGGDVFLAPRNMTSIDELGDPGAGPDDVDDEPEAAA